MAGFTNITLQRLKEEEQKPRISVHDLMKDPNFAKEIEKILKRMKKWK